MSHSEPVLQQVCNRWRAQGVPIRPGASADAIRAFERSRAVRLPAEVERFYRLMDGMAYGSMDEALNCFWPLSEIDTVPARLSEYRGIPDYSDIATVLPDAASYYTFADHSINLNVFAMRLDQNANNPALVIGICGSSWWPVADSFAEFLQLYADDPMSIH